MRYRWYREKDGRLEPVGPESPGSWPWAGGAAQCLRRVTATSTGLWICKAYNVYGDATAHITLSVQDTLTVTVEPTVLVRSSIFSKRKAYLLKGSDYMVRGRAGGGRGQHGALLVQLVGRRGGAVVAAQRRARGRRRRAGAARRGARHARRLPVRRAPPRRLFASRRGAAAGRSMGCILVS